VAAASSVPLKGLAPRSYGSQHTAFEALSNQRSLIADWLVDRLSAGHVTDLSILAVGCGDGLLDAAIAERLLAGGRDRGGLRYVGVEPLPASALQFGERMGRIDSNRLSFDTVVAPFAESLLNETFDVVTFVHSMYYMPDIGRAVRVARALLRPNGIALVLSAPRGELNLLVDLFAPAIDGHRQWFSNDVYDTLTSIGFDPARLSPIEAVVDLTGASDDVLDFTVQAELTPEFRTLVRRYLAEVSLVAGRSVVPHPVDVYAVRAASSGSSLEATRVLPERGTEPDPRHRLNALAREG
jgi:SAM-dependent methyltransferase